MYLEWIFSTLSVIAVSGINIDSSWKWSCESTTGYCTRVSSDASFLDANLYPTVELCRLVCAKSGTIWPKPTKIDLLEREIFIVNPNLITIQPTISQFSFYNSKLLTDIISLFKENLIKNISGCQNVNQRMSVTLQINSSSEILDWNTNENYTLKIASDAQTLFANIQSATIFGARHALESLLHLTALYPSLEQNCLAVIKSAVIQDNPVYKHRGLLLDTSRNFLTTDSIKKHIDGMGASKMNFLHWHMTDSHSFPVEMPSVPNMTLYGAYNPDKIYKKESVSDLVNYALIRGVRIIFELDAPSHAGYGWQWGPEANLGNLVVCLNQQPWRSFCVQPPCGQLNPSNQNIYQVLRKIYSDIYDYYPSSEIFHMGGDELFIPCWNSSDEILNYIKNKPRTTETFLDLWSEFQNKALKTYDSAVGHDRTKVILWTSHLTDPSVIQPYLPKERYVIQTWVPNTDDLPDQLLQLGYSLIISTKNAWYLDHGFWGTTLYYDWRTVYNNKILPSSSNKVLGGEVCMWGEYVDDMAVEGRVWPRAAAAAERLWSDPVSFGSDVEGRFYQHRQRLVRKGIRAEAVTPMWCYYNDGKCL